MVGHQAKRVNPRLKPLTGDLKDSVKMAAIHVVNEDILAVIAAKDYMVNRPRCVNACFSRHRG
jgi:hypothetical protein